MSTPVVVISRYVRLAARLGSWRGKALTGMREVLVPEDCVILDLPEGLRLNLLGLIVQIDRILITADRAGLLGGLLASLTCGGVESADRLEALAQMIRSQEQPVPEEPAAE
jgi:hypothetical protein